MDDEDFILESLSGIMEQCGYDHATARDGREAIDKYEEAARAGRPFDIVIMDLTIPGGMGGKEAAAELKHTNPDVICIVSSGYSGDAVLSRPEEYGFDGVITKPYTIEDVANTIESVIKRKCAARKP